MTSYTIVLDQLQAKKLTNTDGFFNKSDPYLIVSDRAGQEFKTGVVRDNLNPQWRESFSFQGMRNGRSLFFSVYDKDKGIFNPDDNLGTMVLTLNNLQNNQSVANWHRLQGKTARKGEIFFRMSVYSEQQQGNTSHTYSNASYAPPSNVHGYVPQQNVQYGNYPPPNSYGPSQQQQYGNYAPPSQQQQQYGNYAPPPPQQQYGGYAAPPPPQHSGYGPPPPQQYGNYAAPPPPQHSGYGPPPPEQQPYSQQYTPPMQQQPYGGVNPYYQGRR